MPDITLVEHASIHRDAPLPFLEIGDRLCGSVAQTGQPLHLSRGNLTEGKRRLRDEARFETFLREHGVLVVHPETLPMAEQIRLVRSHRVIIAPWGSALHLTNFTGHGPQVYMLEDRNRIGSNYLLWGDASGVPIPAIECLAKAPAGDDLLRAFDMDTAAAHLHAEGIVRTPYLT